MNVLLLTDMVLIDLQYLRPISLQNHVVFGLCFDDLFGLVLLLLRVLFVAVVRGRDVDLGGEEKEEEKKRHDEE